VQTGGETDARVDRDSHGHRLVSLGHGEPDGTGLDSPRERVVRLVNGPALPRTAGHGLDLLAVRPDEGDLLDLAQGTLMVKGIHCCGSSIKKVSVVPSRGAASNRCRRGKPAGVSDGPGSGLMTWRRRSETRGGLLPSAGAFPAGPASGPAFRGLAWASDGGEPSQTATPAKASNLPSREDRCMSSTTTSERHLIDDVPDPFTPPGSWRAPGRSRGSLTSPARR